MEIGQTDDVIDVEIFDKRTHTSNNGFTRSFKTVRKREEVDMQWVRTVVTVVIPMIFFDNVEVRKVVFIILNLHNRRRRSPGASARSVITLSKSVSVPLSV